MRIFSTRRGTTLVELLLFVALIALASGTVVGFLFMTADSRLRQQVHTDLQQVSVQLQQQLLYEIRGTERVLLPARGHTGSVLVLQGASADSSPVILAAVSGSLILVRGANTSPITPGAITAHGLTVTNVSPADARPGVDIFMELREKVPLPDVQTVTSSFVLGASLLPTDAPEGDACGCPAPTCVNGALQWYTCLAGTCDAVTTIPISCP